MSIILSLSARLKNRKTLTKPLLVDLNTNVVVLGIFSTLTDDFGSFDGIDLHISEKRKFTPLTTYGVEESTFVVPNSFETFEEVLEIDMKEFSSPRKIVVNPDFIVRKVYIPELNKTNIYVENGTFDDKILTVAGDITEAGNAYYGEYGSYGV